MRIDTDTFRDIAVSLCALSDAWLRLVGTVARGADTSTARALAERLVDPMTNVTQSIDTINALLRAVLVAQPDAEHSDTVQ